MIFRLSLLTFFFCTSAHSAVLIEDGGLVPATPSQRTTAQLTPESSYLNGLALRAQRPVSAGTTLGGPQGLWGVQGELNFRPDLSALAAFGGGTGFQSVTVQIKRVYEGTYLLPYVAAGYSHWFSTTHDEMTESTPSFLADSFLSSRSKQSGRFAENIVFPSAGLQYVQLHGPLTGASIYAEVTALIDLNRLVMAPTGGVGALYYF